MIEKLINLEYLELLPLLLLLWLYIFVNRFNTLPLLILSKIFDIISTAFVSCLKWSNPLLKKKLISLAIIIVIYFYYISVNIWLNFIYFIIKNRLYYFNCAYKLLKTNLMSVNCLELLILLLLPQLLICNNFFFISSVKLLITLLILLTFNFFIYCLDKFNLLQIIKLINLGCLKLLF